MTPNENARREARIFGQHMIPRGRALIPGVNRANQAPKEQPPRKLSGKKDRMGDDLLESEAVILALRRRFHRRGNPGFFF
jgi:hypothetical protein